MSGFYSTVWAKHYQISHYINCMINCTYFIHSISMTFSHRIKLLGLVVSKHTFYKLTNKPFMMLLFKSNLFCLPDCHSTCNILLHNVLITSTVLIYLTLLSPIAEMREPANTGTCLLQWAPEDVAIVLSIPNVVVTCENGQYKSQW